MNNQRGNETVNLEDPEKRTSDTTSDSVLSASAPTEVIQTGGPTQPDAKASSSGQTGEFVVQPEVPTSTQTVDLSATSPLGAAATDEPSISENDKGTVEFSASFAAQVSDFTLKQVEAENNPTVDFVAPGRADPGATLDEDPSPDAEVQGTVDFIDGHRGRSSQSSLKVSVFDSKGSGGASNWPTVAGYQLMGELGRGGMGVVYKARQRGLHRLVALKMILAGAHAGELQLARFNTEAEAVARLQHPNIVQIYEVGDHNGLPYFSLEFVDGGPLDKKIAGTPQSPRDAASMIETLARAMHFAHKEGIIHRDLKPANVLLTSTGVPKITDFGLAKRLEEGDSGQTKSGTIMGTPSYMAPEQARGDIRQVGPLSDLYSLGAILYELLTGRPPFLGANAMDTVIQVTRNDPVAPGRLQPKTPRDLETICLKCLQKDPQKRYSDCFELAEDLHRYLVGQPILARPVGSMERLWRWCQRNPRLAAASAAILVLLIVVSVGSSWAAITIQAKKELAEQNEQKARESKELAELNEQKAKESKELAEINEKKAKESEKEANEQRMIAESQADLSLSTLGLLINKVQTQLGKQPGAQQLKRDLLQTAMNGLKQVTGGTAGKMRRNMSDAYFKMGGIAREFGNSAEANSYWQKYYEMADEALRENPNNEHIKLEMAWASRFLGEISVEMGDYPKAVKYYEKALTLRKELAAVPVAERLRRNAQVSEEDRLTPRLNQLQLSEDYTRTGLIHYFSGNSAQAEEPVLKSLAVREALVNETARDQAMLLITINPASFSSLFSVASCLPVQFDQVNELRQNLARNYHLIGEVYFRLRNLKQSKFYYQKCEDIREGILRDDEIAVEQSRQTGKPKPPDFRLMGDLAEFHRYYGDMLFSLGAPMPEVVLHIDRSIDLSRKVLEIDKAVGVRQNLAKALYSRGIVAEREGDRPLAAKSFRDCLEIREDLAEKDAKSYRKKLDLLEALSRAGQYERAVQLVEKLRLDHQKDAEFLICSARSYTQSSKAVADKPELQRQYLDKALADVQSALANGYKDAIALETHPDLDPIRPTAEFKKLLEKMNPPPSEGASLNSNR